MTETPDPIFEQASKQPEAAAIIAGDETISYHDLHFRVERVSACLRKHRISAGDRVAIAVTPTVACLAAIAAILRVGATVCCMSLKLPTIVLTEQLRMLSPILLVTSGDSVLPSFQKSATFEELVEDVEDHQRILIASAWPLDRHVTILFTSGSTDQPKAALHTWGNHYYSALGSSENIPFGPGNRWLLSLPLYHVGGLAILFRALVGGGTVVLPDHLNDLTDTILHHRVSHLSLVATQLYRLFQTPDKLEKLREPLKAVLLGGGPIPDGLVREACRLGLPIHTSYGLTEMSSQVATTPAGALPARIGTAGHILPHRELRIGTHGVIYVRGETRFAGYVNERGLETPFDDDGWYETGDTGSRDRDGFLTIAGRRDNMFISGGENIQAEEVEAAIRALPGILDAIVVPVPDDEFGMVPVAYVQFTQPSETPDNALPDLAAVQQQLRHVLPAFKVPKLIIHSDFPESGPTLKKNRQEFIERAWRDYRDRY